MIRVLGRIPSKVAIAVSGGADSMAALSFSRNGGKRDLIALHFNHGSEHAQDAESLVRAYCEVNGIPLVIGRISRDKRKEESQEEYWRNERYGFFSSYADEGHERVGINKGELTKLFCSITTIITAHHLGDSIENWVFTSLHGMGRLIPYKRDNYLRPFLFTNKEDLVSWCERKSVPYIVDPSNSDSRYMRNYIRNELLPMAMVVNPGIAKTVGKLVMAEYENYLNNL
jgi:tRNA(Ile)-lysidine synthase